MNETLRHSLVYALGHVVVRLGSLIMLPIYTHYLTPADYGAIAILDLTAAVIAVVVGGGLVAAVNRLHFTVPEGKDPSSVWWTGLLLVFAASVLLLTPLWLWRVPLAGLLRGLPEDRAALYLSLILPHLGFELVGQIAEQYFRTHKRSTLIVGLSLARLACNMTLNVALLAGLSWGVAGVLTGNLLTAAGYTMVWCVLLADAIPPLIFPAPKRAPRASGSLRLSEQLPTLNVSSVYAWELLRFGAPLVLSGLSALVMHYADRYFLEWSHGLESVGEYSLAYTLVYALAMLMLTPFTSIWSAQRYEVAAQTDAPQTFARVFATHFQAFLLAMFALALFAPLTITILAGDAYAEAARLTPILAMAYVMYGMRPHFETPIFLARKTQATIPIHIGVVVLNLALNAALIPTFGGAGAAWATVATFAVFAASYALLGRKFLAVPWPIGQCGLQLGVAAALFGLLTWLNNRWGPAAYYPLAFVTWALFAWAIGYRSLVRMLSRPRDEAQSLAASESAA